MSEMQTGRTEADLRGDYEKAYTQRMLTIQKFYEVKYETLYDAIQQVYNAVIHDQMLKTFKKDATTAEFILERVKEVFQDIVGSQRETLIERLGQQMVQLRSELSKRDSQVHKLTEQVDKMHSQIRAKSQNLQSLTDRLKEEQGTRRSQSQSALFTTERELNDCKKTIDNIKNENGRIKNEIQEKQRRLNSSARHNEQLLKRNKDLQVEIEQLRRVSVEEMRHRSESELSCRQSVALLEKKLKQVSASSVQLEQSLKKHYKQKSAEYKNKIEKYKEKVTELLKNEAKLEKQKALLSKAMEDVETRLASAITQGEARIVEQRNIREKEKAQLEKKHDWQMREAQIHYERLLQAKIKEVELQSQNSLAVMEELQREFRCQITQRAEDYEVNYVRRQRFDSLMSEKQQNIKYLKNKLEQRESEIREALEKLNKCTSQRDDLTQCYKQACSVIDSHDAVFIQMKERKKQLEQKIEQLLAADKKGKRATSELQNRFSEISLELQEKSKKLTKCIQKLASQQAALQNLQNTKNRQIQQLNEQAKKIQQTMQQMSTITKKSQQTEVEIEKMTLKLNQSEKNLSKAEQEKAAMQQQLAKSTQQLQEQFSKSNKISEKLEKEEGLKIKLQDQIDYLEKQIKEQKATMKEISSKHKEEQLALEQKQEMIRRDIDQQKLQNLQRLEQSSTLSHKISELKMLLTRKQEKLIKINGKMTMFRNSLISITKQSAALKEYISNIKKAHFSQMALWLSILQRDFEDILRKKDIHYLNLGKETAQRIASLKNERQEHIKNEMTVFINQKGQENREIKEELKGKVQQIENLQRIVAETSEEKKSLLFKIKQLQQKMQQIRQKSHSEQEKYERKLTNLKQQWQNQKNALLTESNLKNEQYQADFKDLQVALVTLKKECVSLKEHFDQSKTTFRAQLKDSERRRQEIEYSNSEMKASLENLMRTVSSLTSEKQRLEDSIKQLQDERNRQNLEMKTEIKNLQDKLTKLQENNEVLEEQRKELLKEKDHLKTQVDEAREQGRILQQDMAQMNAIIGRTVRNADSESLKAAKMLDGQTRELAARVRQLRKLNNYLGEASTLRS